VELQALRTERSDLDAVNGILRSQLVACASF
jgi:hypothetical protein